MKEHSRANNLWARPQELLASIGIRDLLADSSYAIRRINFMMNGTSMEPMQVEQVDSPYPRVLYSGQDVIEKTLVTTLEERGVTVERGWTVTNVRQDDDAALVDMQHGDGSRRTVRAR